MQQHLLITANKIQTIFDYKQINQCFCLILDYNQIYESNYEIDFYATKSNSAGYIQVAYLLSSDKTIKREF